MCCWWGWRQVGFRLRIRILSGARVFQDSGFHFLRCKSCSWVLFVGTRGTTNKTHEEPQSIRGTAEEPSPVSSLFRHFPSGLFKEVRTPRQSLIGECLGPFFFKKKIDFLISLKNKNALSFFNEITADRRGVDRGLLDWWWLRTFFFG